MKNTIDLHTHSDCSDGTLSPEQLIDLAADCGLSAIALTDHDTTAGIPAASARAKQLGIELIPGIEFSAAACGTEVHIVGLDIDPEDPQFSQTVAEYRRRREGRNGKIIERMRSDGYEVSEQLLQEQYGDAVITRAHFARFLMEHGAAESIKEAFSRYLGEGCPYYIPRQKIPAEEAVRLIAENGGIPVLAHPFQYNLDKTVLEDLVRRLKTAGLIGIEAYYSTHTQWQTEEIQSLAKRMGLCPSGGSDFHGANKPAICLGTGFGNLHIHINVLDNLRAAAGREK